MEEFNVDFNNWFEESSLGDLSDPLSEIGKSINKLKESEEAYEKDGAILKEAILISMNDVETEKLDIFLQKNLK